MRNTIFMNSVIVMFLGVLLSSPIIAMQEKILPIVTVTLGSLKRLFIDDFDRVRMQSLFNISLQTQQFVEVYKVNEAGYNFNNNSLGLSDWRYLRPELVYHDFQFKNLTNQERTHYFFPHFITRSFVDEHGDKNKTMNCLSFQYNLQFNKIMPDVIADDIERLDLNSTENVEQKKPEFNSAITCKTVSISNEQSISVDLILRDEMVPFSSKKSGVTCVFLLGEISSADKVSKNDHIQFRTLFGQEWDPDDKVYKIDKVTFRNDGDSHDTDGWYDTPLVFQNSPKYIELQDKKHYFFPHFLPSSFVEKILKNIIVSVKHIGGRCLSLEKKNENEETQEDLDTYLGILMSQAEKQEKDFAFIPRYEVTYDFFIQQNFCYGRDLDCHFQGLVTALGISFKGEDIFFSVNAIKAAGDVKLPCIIARWFPVKIFLDEKGELKTPGQIISLRGLNDNNYEFIIGEDMLKVEELSRAFWKERSPNENVLSLASAFKLGLNAFIAQSETSKSEKAIGQGVSAPVIKLTMKYDLFLKEYFCYYKDLSKRDRGFAKSLGIDLNSLKDEDVFFKVSAIEIVFGNVEYGSGSARWFPLEKFLDEMGEIKMSGTVSWEGKEPKCTYEITIDENQANSIKERQLTSGVESFFKKELDEFVASKMTVLSEEIGPEKKSSEDLMWGMSSRSIFIGATISAAALIAAIFMLLKTNKITMPPFLQNLDLRTLLLAAFYKKGAMS